jgi:hypothetical membrane protein
VTTSQVIKEHAFLVKWLALCGIIAVLWYNLMIIIAGSLSQAYDHMHNSIFALGANGSPVAWFYNPLGPILYGVLIVLFSIGLYIGRAGRIGSFFLGISGIGEIIAGLFPLTFEASQPHFIGLLSVVVGTILMLFAFTVSMRRKDVWKSLWKYTLVTAIAFTVSFVVIMLEVFNFAAGLSERVLIWIAWLWILVIAYRLYRLHS